MLPGIRCMNHTFVANLLPQVSALAGLKLLGVSAGLLLARGALRAVFMYNLFYSILIFKGAKSICALLY